MEKRNKSIILSWVSGVLFICGLFEIYGYAIPDKDIAEFICGIFFAVVSLIAILVAIKK